MTAHALTRFIRQQMEMRSWDQAKLVNESGLSRAHVSKLVNDERASIVRPHDRETLVALASAFRVPYMHVLGLEIEALGLQHDSTPLVVELSESSDEDLLAEVRRRMETNRAGIVEQPRFGAGSRRTAMRRVQQEAAREDDE